MAHDHLTDTELLSSVLIKRNQSPLINELCNRMEALLEQVDELQEQIKACGPVQVVTCPVCEAKLTAEQVSTDIELKGL